MSDTRPTYYYDPTSGEPEVWRDRALSACMVDADGTVGGCGKHPEMPSRFPAVLRCDCRTVTASTIREARVKWGRAAWRFASGK